LTVTAIVGDFQARHLGLPAAAQQGLPVGAFVLRVNTLDVERKPG